MMGPAVGTMIVREGLERAGVSVVHVNTQDRRTVFNVGTLDIRNVLLGLRHTAETAWQAVRWSVDLVYVPISQGRWGYARDAALIATSCILRKPVVVHLRGANFQQFYATAAPADRFVIRHTLAQASRAIVLTPSLRGVFAGLIPPERVRVLENAVVDPWPLGVEELVAARRRRAQQDPSAPNLLYVANDFAQKGFRTVIRALTHPGLEHARLRMVGAPPAPVAAEALLLASELGVRDRVELTGERLGREKHAEFAWADIFAYPTENDGQPLVVIEALAAGLPVVSTTFGGVPDTVGNAGVVVRPGDEAGFAVALRSLIRDPEKRLALGEAARARYLARYTPTHFQARLEVLFAEVLDEATRCAA